MMGDSTWCEVVVTAPSESHPEFPPQPEFPTVDILSLSRMSSEELDALPFGVVGLSRQGIVESYNATESRLAGLPPETVIGSPFFLSVAQCMNNYIIAQRLEDEAELDVDMPYVLTFRMRPTPVRLRLLKSEAVSRAYVLIQR